MLPRPCLYRRPADEDGFTALHEAAQNGHEECAKRLMVAGANPYAKTNDDGNTPLHRAAFFGHVLTSTVLVAAMSSVGEGVDVRNTAGETPLMVAASRGRDEVVRLLITAGAEIFATNEDGKTAIDMASKRNKARNAVSEKRSAGVRAKHQRRAEIYALNAIMSEIVRRQF